MTERANSQEPTTSLSQYAAPLRDHGRIVALVTGLTLVVGVLAAALGPKTYTATTAVLVYPVSSDPTEALQSIDRSNDLVTELRIANSRSVAQATSEAFQEVTLSVTPETVASNLSASAAEDSRVLDIAYTSSDPGVARVGSELAANAYLDYRSQLNEASRESARTLIDEQIADLQDQLVDAEARIDRSVAGSPTRLVAEVERDSIEGELSAHQAVLADLSILALDVATVIDAPREPSAPDGLGPVPLVVGSAAGGLILGLIAAWTLALLGAGAGNENRTRVAAPSRTTAESVTAPAVLAEATPEAAPVAETGPEAEKAAPAAREKGSRLLRRRPRDARADGGDDPFDDTDSRDPLELIRALDAMEQAEAVLTHRHRNAAAKAQTEPEAPALEETSTDEPSFSDLYPVEYVDRDGAPDADAADEDTDEDAGQDTDEDGAEASGELDVDPFGADGPFAGDDTTDDAIEQFAADGFDGRDFGAIEESPAGDPGPEDWADTSSWSDGQDWTVAEAETEADGSAADDEADDQDDEDPFGVEAEAGADDLAEPVGEAIEASLDHATTGDPNSLDPGPASWDGPFVGPTQWDDLATAAGLTTGDADPDASGDALVASGDADALFEKLSELGAAGPVAILSLGDRDPAAGLTAGFELADELRALGARILLIDARLDQPVLDGLFEDGAGIGLAQVMTGEVLLRNGVRGLPGLEGLDLLTVGSLDDDTGDHLAGAAFERLLAEARMEYQAIVIIGDTVTSNDTVAASDPSVPADLGRTEALAAMVDGLVVGTGLAAGTPADEDLARSLSSLTAPVLQLTSVTVPSTAEPMAASGS